MQTVALTSYPEPKPALDATPSPIPQDHDTIFVDTLVGHRAHAKFLSRLGQRWAKDVVNHNSHVLVIRKREVAEPAALPPQSPSPPPIPSPYCVLESSASASESGLVVLEKRHAYTLTSTLNRWRGSKTCRYTTATARCRAGTR